MNFVGKQFSQDIKKRKILFFSGSRADYGRLFPIWKEVAKHPDLEMILCVSGTHLSKEFGFTLSNFFKDGFKVDYTLPTLLREGEGSAIAKSIGIGLITMNDIVNKEQPDMVFVFGDRSEMLIPAIAAVHSNIPLVHMAGGYNTFGIVDEVVRHALTKMAHIHLATSEKCAERIIRMGEEQQRVYFVGSPAIDSIKKMSYFSKEKVFRKLGLDINCPLIIVTFHPVTTEYNEMEGQIEQFVNAFNNVNAQVIITYPNTDLGGELIIEHLKNSKRFRIVADLTPELYLNILKHADLMVGNSSSGFIESPYFNLPVINVGNRQMGRDREINVIDVEMDSIQISSAIHTYLNNQAFREKIKNEFKNTYGTGDAAQKTVEILSNIILNRELIQKKMTY